MVNVGDMVYIIKNPPRDRNWGPAFVLEMDKYCGRICKVVDIWGRDEDGGDWFYIDIDGRHFVWCEDYVVKKKRQRTE